MNNYLKIGIVVVLVGAAAAATVARRQRKASAPAAGPGSPVAATDGVSPTPQAALPRLVDLGAHSCIPCRKMAPILEELRSEYAGRMKVEFIDVWQDPDAGSRYGIRLIPTQIFFDASGKELFRHEGFLSKEAILGQWALMGVALDSVTPVPGTPQERREEPAPR